MHAAIFAGFLVASLPTTAHPAAADQPGSTADALAWLDCAVVDRHPAGTHVIYVGRVEAGSVARPEARPLVYWDRDYRRLAR